jgi:hypothetical protein
MSSKRIERLIEASPSEVFHYFTNSTAIRDWMCNIATTDPRPGGHLYFCWPEDYYTCGEFIQLETDPMGTCIGEPGFSTGHRCRPSHYPSPNAWYIYRRIQPRDSQSVMRPGYLWQPYSGCCRRDGCPKSWFA